MTDQTDSSARIVTCLIAGREAGECYPSLLRYLQLGLVGESIETLRVVLQGEPLQTLQAGTSLILQDRPLAWPLSRWSRRIFLDMIERKLESLQRGCPAIVHALGPSAVDTAAHVAEATGAELVLTVAATSQIDDSASARCMQRASTIVALSQRLAESVPAPLRAARPVQVTRVGISAGASPAAFRDDSRSPVLLYAGPLTEEARVDSILRAVKQLQSRHPNLLLFIIGKGPAESALRRLIDSLEISDGITFTGKIDDWRVVLESADIFCQPGAIRSWREEPLCAMAAGVCVVAAQDGACDELIDEKTALLFPEDDDAALAQRISRLLTERDFARQLAQSAQAYVRASHSPSGMVAAHLQLYRALTARHQTLSFPAH